MKFISYPSYNDVNNQLKKITDIKASNNKIEPEMLAIEIYT